MKKEIRQSLQALGLLTNFFGLSTFFHNYLSGLFAVEERFFFTLSLVFALCLPIPLVYLGLNLALKAVSDRKKSRWQKILENLR